MTKGPSDKGGNKGGKKGDKGKGKGKGKNGGGRYGAYAGYKGVSRKRASRLVDAEINPLLRDLAHEIQNARRLSERTTGDLKHIFGESGDYLKHLAQKNQGAFNNFGNDQEAARAALIQQMQSQGDQTGQGAMAELQRLGLGNQFLGQMAADQQNSVNMANQQMGHSRETAGLMNLGASSMSNALRGMNQGSRTSQIGQAINNRNQTIFDIKRERRDLNQQRPELMRQMLEQMAAQGWGQYVDQRNLNQNQQALNLQKQGQAFSQSQAQSSQASQNAYNSTLSSLYQQQLANTYGKKP